MAEAKSKSDEERPVKTDQSHGDQDEVRAGGGEEVQEKVDEAVEKGVFGDPVDPIPNKEYSLESGPDSPSIQEQSEAIAKRDSDRGRRSAGSVRS